MYVQKAQALLEDLIIANRPEADIVRGLLDELRDMSGKLMKTSHTATCDLGPRDPDAKCTCGVSHAADTNRALSSMLTSEPIDRTIALVFGSDERK